MLSKRMLKLLFYILSILLVAEISLAENALVHNNYVVTNQSNKVILSELDPTQQSNSQNIANNIESIHVDDHLYYPSRWIKDTNDFYNLDSNPVFDQGYLPWCSVFAVTSGVSYAKYGNTKKVSPLYSIFKMIDKGEDINNIGIVGLTSLSAIKDQEKYFSSGVYNNSSDLEINLVEYLFTKELESATSRGESNGFTVIHDLLNSAPLQNLINLYKFLEKTPIERNKFRDVFDVKFVDLHLSQGSTSNVQKVVDSLNNGHKVILSFVIYGDSNDLEDYRYDRKNGSLFPSESVLDNTWHLINGKVTSGFHTILVVSYFLDRDGRIMFLLRGSWGSDVGDMGNYYMTDSYLNAAALDGYIVLVK